MESFLHVLQQSVDRNGVLNTEIFCVADAHTFWTKNQLRMLVLLCILDGMGSAKLEASKGMGKRPFSNKIMKKRYILV